MNADSTKEKLISAAVSLIKEDEQNISVRKIVRRASVGVGLVNYYFQSKDNLINIAVQRVVNEVIAKVPALVQTTNGSPTEKLKQTIIKTLDYLDSHPNVSRLSILRDMQDGTDCDNTQLSINAYDKILLDIIPNENVRNLANHILCASIQSAFLRSGILSQTASFDFHNAKQRRNFADHLVDIVLSGIKNSTCG